MTVILVRSRIQGQHNVQCDVAGTATQGYLFGSHSIDTTAGNS